MQPTGSQCSRVSKVVQREDPGVSALSSPLGREYLRQNLTVESDMEIPGQEQQEVSREHLPCSPKDKDKANMSHRHNS